MPRKLLWLRNFSPAKLNSGAWPDDSHHANHGAISGDVELEYHLGFGQAASFNGGVITLQEGSLWAFYNSSPWMYAATNQTSLTLAVYGKYSSAIYTWYEQGGKYYVRITNPAHGAGNVRWVVGVFDQDLEFDEPDWIESDPSEIPYNEYFGYGPDRITNTTGETILELESQPVEATVQVWLVAGNVQDYARRWEPLSFYAVLRPHSKIGDRFERALAGFGGDGEQEVIFALWAYEQVRGRDTSKLRTFHWNEVKKSLGFGDARIIDKFNGFIDNEKLTNNRVWGSKNKFREIQDPDDAGNNILVMEAAFDSAWQGCGLVYPIWQDAVATNYPWSLWTQGLKVKYKASENLGAFIHLVVNNSLTTDTDADKELPERIYHAVLPDTALAWTEAEVGWNKFIRLDNLVADGARVKIYSSWVWGTGGTNVFTFVPGEFDADSWHHYGYYRFSRIGSGGYTPGFGFSPDLGTEHQNETTFNFLARRIGTTGTITITVTQGATQCTRNFTVGTSWERKSFTYADFAPDLDPGESIDAIEFECAEGDLFDFDLTDIKFGDHHVYADEMVNILEVGVDLYSHGINDQLFYLDYVELGPEFTHLYNVPTISTKWTAFDYIGNHSPSAAIADFLDLPQTTGDGRYLLGRHPERGLASLHYLYLMAPHVMSDTAIRDNYLEMIKDSQDAYYARNGGVKGPFFCRYSPGRPGSAYDYDAHDWCLRRNDFRKEKGRWLFNDSLVDASREGNTLSYLPSGSPSYTTGAWQPGNTAIQLDGSHYVALAEDHPDFKFGINDFTVEITLKRGATGACRLVSCATSTGGTDPDVGFEIVFNASNVLQLLIADSTGLSTISSGLTLTDTAEFHHIIVAVDRDENVYFWIDDNTSEVAAARPGSLDHAGKFAVGRRAYADTGYFTGSIDLVRIQNGRADTGTYTDWTNYVMQGTYTGPIYVTSQALSALRLAEYYFYSGDADCAAPLAAWLNWVDTYGRVNDGGWQWPQFWSIYGYGYSSTRQQCLDTAALAMSLLYYYWATEDATAATWVRRILDDMTANMWDSVYGGFKNGDTWDLVGNGQALKLFGMVVNGPLTGYSGYAFTSTQADEDKFQELYDWLVNNAGEDRNRATPNTMNNNLVPYYYALTEANFTEWPEFLIEWGLGSSEAASYMIWGALEYGRFSNDYRLFDVLSATFVASLDLGHFTLGAWCAVAAGNGYVVYKEDAYYLKINSGLTVTAAFYDEFTSAWITLTSTETLTADAMIFVAATFDGYNFKLYFNGKLVQSSTHANSPLPAINANDVQIGYNYAGKIGELAMWPYALDAAELRRFMLGSLRRESLQLIELLELSVPYSSTPLCFSTYQMPLEISSLTPSNARVRYTYVPLGWDRGGIKREMLGRQNTLTFRTAVNDTVLELLKNYDIRGQQVIVKATFADASHSDPETVVTLFVGKVMGWTMENEVISVEARYNTLDLGGQVPPAQYDYFCRHFFKKARCQYVGEETTCDKTETACTGYVNTDQFGGFKFMPRLMRRKGI